MKRQLIHLNLHVEPELELLLREAAEKNRLSLSAYLRGLMWNEMDKNTEKK